jgi:hypothetical protein
MKPNAIRANFPKYLYLVALAAFFAFADGKASAQNVYTTDTGGEILGQPSPRQGTDSPGRTDQSDF